VGSPVTANLFPLLGVSPILGRTFSDAEDRPGGPRVVLIGYGLWQRRFGGDAAIIGRGIWWSWVVPHSCCCWWDWPPPTSPRASPPLIRS